MFQFNQHVTSSNLVLAGVPIIHFSPKVQQLDSHKTIFLYHGWMSRKENLSLLANLLCLKGYHVISPDAHFHGERGGSLDYSPEKRHLFFWEVVTRTVDEGSTIMEEAVRRGLAYEGKIALIGDSMGGTIATGIFSRNKNIQALANINGCAAWEYLEHLTRETENKEVFDEGELHLIQQYDPINRIADMFPRPVLLIHGTADTILPISCQEQFVGKAESVYASQPDKLGFVKVPRMNHFISMGMIETVLDWLERSF